jgi:hypothetical protein
MDQVRALLVWLVLTHHYQVPHHVHHVDPVLQAHQDRRHVVVVTLEPIHPPLDLLHVQKAFLVNMSIQQEPLNSTVVPLDIMLLGMVQLHATFVYQEPIPAALAPIFVPIVMLDPIPTTMVLLCAYLVQLAIIPAPRNLLHAMRVILENTQMD